MDRQCSKCRAKLESPWKFCPHCGAAGAEESHEKSTPPEHEKAPVLGPFSGLLLGIVATPILIIVGTMLCLTGLGAFLGVPMILAGVIAPLAGPMMGLGALKGKCPWCGAAVSGMESARNFNCLACSQRIAIQHREFVKAA
jgi:DNA-directed RNA polymerase subunit RPC12/RpoP